MGKDRHSSLPKAIFLYLTAISIVSVLSVAALWIYFERATFKKETQKLRQLYIDSQKLSIKQEVDRAKAFVEFMQSQTEARLKASIKGRVNEAHAIALNLYQLNRSDKTREEIETIVKEALRPIRFNKNRGYYFAFNLDGIEQLFAAKPEMEGKNMLAVQGGRGEFVVADMLAIVRQKKEGFYQYYWSKPGRTGFFPKIAFIKLIEPLNWVVGTGEYLDDVEKDIQEEVLRWVDNISFGADGYVFAGQWDGLSLSGPATGKNMWDITDANGVKIVQELIKASKSGSGYVHYTQPDFKGRKSGRKISYAVGVPDWQWYIGAGIYVDQIESLIAEKQVELSKRIGRDIRYAVLIFAVLLVAILMIVKVIADRIQRNFSSFANFFAGASDDDIKIDSKALDFKEFAELAVAANQMIKKRKEAEVALKESREWLRTILDSIQSGVMVIDATEKRIIDLNHAALMLIGAERIQILEQTCYEFLCPDQVEPCTSMDSEKESRQYECVLKRADGSHVPILKSCSRLQIGGKAYNIESFLDLSEQKKLEDQLRQAHKIEALGLLAGGVAHDLNNMLSPVIGFAEMMLVDSPANDPQREYLAKILSAGMKARDLVHQLLAFGRKQALEIQSIDINALIVGLEKLLRRTIPENITMDFVLDPSSPVVKADAGQLEQVVMNLILNARDAMPNGGKLTVDTRNVALEEVDWEAPEQLSPGLYVQLTISDTGAGIEPDAQQRIFDPFFTTKETGHGTGLGLAMVYGIVKQHGGSIWVDSSLGKGTRFVIYLPVSEGPADLLVDNAEPQTHSGGQETILVVEDNDSVRDLVTTILESLGYQVLAASGVSQCMEVLETYQGSLHLVLTDVVMPDINGKELFEQIKASYTEAKVIFMSGYTDHVIAQHGVLEEGLHFIQKPFTVKGLSSKVREVLTDKSNILSFLHPLSAGR